MRNEQRRDRPRPATRRLRPTASRSRGCAAPLLWPRLRTAWLCGVEGLAAGGCGLVVGVAGFACASAVVGGADAFDGDPSFTAGAGISGRGSAFAGGEGAGGAASSRDTGSAMTGAAEATGDGRRVRAARHSLVAGAFLRGRGDRIALPTRVERRQTGQRFRLGDAGLARVIAGYRSGRAGLGGTAGAPPSPRIRSRVVGGRRAGHAGRATTGRTHGAAGELARATQEDGQCRGREEQKQHGPRDGQRRPPAAPSPADQRMVGGRPVEPLGMHRVRRPPRRFPTDGRRRVVPRPAVMPEGNLRNGRVLLSSQRGLRNLLRRNVGTRPRLHGRRESRLGWHGRGKGDLGLDGGRLRSRRAEFRRWQPIRRRSDSRGRRTRRFPLRPRALFADRRDDDFRRHRLPRPALGELQRAAAGANDGRRHAAAVTDDHRDRVRAERLFRASRGAQPMTYHPGHVRLDHRLELHRPVRRLRSAVTGDCRDARRDVRMSRQDGRKKTPICRLQSGQRDDRFQHVVAEQIGVVEQKDRRAIAFDELPQLLRSLEGCGGRLGQAQPGFAGAEYVGERGSAAAREHLRRTQGQNAVERLQLFGEMTKKRGLADAGSARKQKEPVSLVQSRQQPTGGVPPERIQVTEPGIRRVQEGVL